MGHACPDGGAEPPDPWRLGLRTIGRLSPFSWRGPSLRCQERGTPEGGDPVKMGGRTPSVTKVADPAPSSRPRPGKPGRPARTGLALVLAAWLGLVLPGPAPAAESLLALEQVASEVGRPVTIAHAGDDRLFVVDANGRILLYRVVAD